MTATFVYRHRFITLFVFLFCYSFLDVSSHFYNRVCLTGCPINLEKFLKEKIIIFFLTDHFHQNNTKTIRLISFEYLSSNRQQKSNEKDQNRARMVNMKVSIESWLLWIRYNCLLILNDSSGFSSIP